MDWIERWFGLHPDNGDGSLEAYVLVMLFAIAVALLAATNDWVKVRLESLTRRGVAQMRRWTGRVRG